jgi:hypothetical protein
MSTEQSHIFDWNNGKEQFSIISYAPDYQNSICNFCWGEAAEITISKMLSSEIWPPPIHDKQMVVGNQCITRYISINPKYIAFRVLVEVANIYKDVADVIIGYL